MMRRFAMARKKGFAFVSLALVLLLTLPVLAQSSPSFDLTWNSIAGGGGTSASSNTFSLSGSAGQADAGSLHGGDFTLNGGFWAGGEITETLLELFLPIIRR